MLKGVVVSTAMQKTAVVRVTRLRKHPKYLKYEKRSSRFKVHDEENILKHGDAVVIRETRPISKEKHWTLHAVVKSADKPDQDQGDEAETGL